MGSKLYFPLIIFMVVAIGCRQGKKYHDQNVSYEVSANADVNDIFRFQKQLNEEFRDPETSPLKDKDRIHFEGLDFYEPDTNYIVKANLVRTPDAKPFLMPTTTSRKTHEVVYGIAHFELNGKKHQLEVYQNLDQEEDKDYLFLPFLDDTNGSETYGGGRYVDLTIPDGAILVIDFNRAYNPYCVYNKRYSCPLVPRQNYLRTNVRAGVKAFDRH